MHNTEFWSETLKGKEPVGELGKDGKKREYHNRSSSNWIKFVEVISQWRDLENTVMETQVL
jgi:hypothetical protein